MRPEALPFLCCPNCAADLLPHKDTMRDGELYAGFLQCISCKQQWPIIEGVPDFVATGGDEAVVQTTDGFARNWNAYNEVIVSHDSLNDELFRDWITPLEPAAFEDRVVLDAGCGMGRWLSVSARYRPRALFGLDYSSIAHTAYQNTRPLPHVHVLRADLFRPPLKPVMDVTYSIGVVHHTPDPAKAFDALVGVMAPDGVLAVWVYGEENNEWITKVVSPLREQFTSRLPDSALIALSRVLAVQLRIAAHVQEALPGGRSLPYGDYLRYLRRYPFKYMEHIVYDHLVPQLAYYIPRHEVERWAKKHNLPHQISARNSNSWRLYAAHSEKDLQRYTRRPNRAHTIPPPPMPDTGEE